MSLPSKTDWAYMAGIMDGEGSFCISKVTLHSKSGKPYFGYDCKVMVANTSEVLIKWLVGKFGGKYRVGVNEASKQAQAWGSKKTIRPCYRWTMEGYRNQELFLLAVIPYLVIKRAQAIVALEWTRMLNQKNPAKRLELHKRMIALNAKSPTTNMPNAQVLDLHACYVLDTLAAKIESDLHGDMQSAPVVTRVPANFKQEWIPPSFSWEA